MEQQIEMTRVADIFVGKRLRKVEEEKVSELVGSITANGLIHPIVVRRHPKHPKRFQLVVGASRLAAVKKLGWKKVKATVVDCDDLGAKLMEVDENLIRKELTDLERAEHHKLRKDILEERGEARTRGGDRRSNEQNAHLKSYADQMGENLGIHPATVRRHVRRAESIAEDIKKKIKGTRFDTGSELDALARMSQDEQRTAARKIFTTGKACSFYQAGQQIRRRATKRLEDISEVAERLASYLNRLLDSEHEEIRKLEEIIKFAESLSEFDYEELIPPLEKIEKRAKAYREQLEKAWQEHHGGPLPVIDLENYPPESDALSLPKPG